MARIRTIKPEFNSSESVARMSEAAQLFMVKLLMECDDQGRIRWLPKKIAGALYPFNQDKDAKDIDRYADELESEGIFERYTVDGKTYGRYTKWGDHQRVDKPGKPTCPEPPARPSRDSLSTVEPPFCEGSEKRLDGQSRDSRESPDTGDAPENAPDSNEPGSRNSREGLEEVCLPEEGRGNREEGKGNREEGKGKGCWGRGRG